MHIYYTTDIFNNGWNGLVNLTTNYNIPFKVFLHADTQEVKEQKYNYQGKEILSFLETKNIEVIEELKLEITEEYYRDGIHYNEKGQDFLAKSLYPIILSEISKNHIALQ